MGSSGSKELKGQMIIWHFKRFRSSFTHQRLKDKDDKNDPKPDEKKDKEKSDSSSKSDKKKKDKKKNKDKPKDDKPKEDKPKPDEQPAPPPPDAEAQPPASVRVAHFAIFDKLFLTISYSL